jgi:Flp pilus assembly protein TadB
LGGLAIGCFTALHAAGVAAPGAVVAIATLLAAGSGPLLADAVLRAEASERREELRSDLALFLDLMVLVLAAGAGVETALTTAAAAGDGWAWEQLREALRPVRVTAEPPWEALGRLGQRIGVLELEELAGAVALAVGSGGRMRESLAARAEGLRARELARAQAEAAAATERMTFPVVALAVGFLVVLGYPAVARVLAGF